MKILKTTIAYMTYWLHRYGHLLLPATAAILSFVSTYILFGPVLNRSGDNIYHLMNEYTMVNGARAGDSIFGPLGMEMGQPVLRFYQSLFYMFNAAVHFITGIDLRMVHNITLCVCFGLSPFSLYYFMRKLRMNKWTAGLASYMSLISVAAFGNSFEAFFQAGIVTQAMGGLFFPWFMGTFIGMLRGENSPVTAAVLFALAFLSHAIMAVYATFGGALYFLMSETSVRANIKKMVIFAMLGAALVSFWVIPFVEHNKTMRPVPDPIFRGSGVHWYTSVSTAQLIDVAAGGYMLDDSRNEKNDRNDAEKFMDKINIISSLSHRPPIFSILTAFGVLCALFQLRKLSVRFLLGGFAFSLMLFAGPDDFRWTSYLPFMDKVQAFRCTYLYEIFAFGLSALGVEFIVGSIYTFARTRKRWWSKAPFFMLWAAGAGVVLGWNGFEIVKLGQTHLVIREPNILNLDLDALQNVPDRGYPFKVDVRTGGRPKIRHAWFAMNGYMPFCTHWKGTGPETTYKHCAYLGTPKNSIPMLALSGVRWFTGWGPTIKSIENEKDEDGLPAALPVDVGLTRAGAPNSSRFTFDTGAEHFLQPLTGSPLPVICNDKQWLWLTTNWMQNYRFKLWKKAMPVTMRVNGGRLAASNLLNDARAIFYFDHSQVDDDHDALSQFIDSGGVVISPLPIDGLSVVELDINQVPWTALPEDINNAVPDMRVTPREENNPGLEIAQIDHVKPERHTYQQFVFDVENTEPVIAVLPLNNYPGWRAYLNGNEIPTFSTGPDMVGVHLQRGVHRVKFRWEMPLRHKLTIYVSILALLMALGIWVRRVVMFSRNDRFVPFL
ncbi:MAG: hypothetical protein JXX29_01645 [Deltaproteobacteria bacterium]|nr:hypothetical protein [Deltaproteobacteria bacterium]MBN2670343.1 hypothetical protein [Deltaproteobacteria bacterium]